MISISNLPHVSEKQSDKVFVSLPVYVLALRKLKLGIMLVTDFTPNMSSVFYEKTLSSLPSQFSVGGKPLSKAQVFSISVSASRVASVWERMDMQFRLSSYDKCDDQKCDISQLGIIAIVNFKVQQYQGRVEGFLSQMVTCTRRADANDQIASRMQDASFHAFMGRLTGYMNLRLYDEMYPNFPIERFIDREKIDRNVRQKIDLQTLDSQISQRHVTPSLPPTQGLRTQPLVKRRLTVKEVFYQQQESQVLDTRMETGMLETVLETRAPVTHTHKTRTPETCTQETPTSESSGHSKQSGHRQVAETQIPQKALKQTETPKPVHNLRFSVHRVHKLPAAQIQQLQIEQIQKNTMFEFSATITKIYPSPENIFVKPFGKTIRVSPFTVRLGDNPIELHSADEACHFFGVDEIEILINHLTEYSHQLHSLLGLTVKVRVERRGLRFAQGFERAYWGFQSNMQDLLKSTKNT